MVPGRPEYSTGVKSLAGPVICALRSARPLRPTRRVYETFRADLFRRRRGARDGIRRGPVADAADAQGLTKAESDRIAAFADAHPFDFAGLDRLVLEATGENLAMTVNGVPGTVTGTQAQAVYDAREAKYTKGMQQRRDGAVTLAVPVDAFTVTVAFIPVYGPPPTYRARGTSNFRDNVVNGSAPDDFATVAMRAPACYEILGTTAISYNYRNQITYGVTYLQNGGLANNAPVVGVRDRVSGFVMNADKVVMDVTIRAYGGSCGAARIGAQFIYEHNQDGGSVLGVSAGWGFLSVSYGGSPSVLERSTNPIYRN